jgi:hypothetical protein
MAISPRLATRSLRNGLGGMEECPSGSCEGEPARYRYTGCSAKKNSHEKHEDAQKESKAGGFGVRWLDVVFGGIVVGERSNTSPRRSVEDNKTSQHCVEPPSSKPAGVPG